MDKAAIVSKTERSDISIDTIKVDILDAAALPGALRKLEKVGHTVERVFSKRHVLFQASCQSVETIEEDFKICAFVSFDLRVPC